MKHISFSLFAISMIALSSCHDPNADKPSEENPKDTASASIHLKEENVTYSGDNISMKGFVVYNDSLKGKRPAVLVVPEWWGLTEYPKTRAKQLAELGYIAMAVDMYGDGKIANDVEQAKAYSGPFYSNAQMGKARLDAAIAKLKTYSEADTSKIAVIGYCFGGSIAINSAKLGNGVSGVVSFHGGLAGPAPMKGMSTQFLICHGGADAMVPETDVANFKKQMDSVGAKYTFNTYANASHAFSNPEATELGKKFKIPVSYNEEADKKSWNDMKDFFAKLWK